MYLVSWKIQFNHLNSIVLRHACQCYSTSVSALVSPHSGCFQMLNLAARVMAGKYAIASNRQGSIIVDRTLAPDGTGYTYKCLVGRGCL